ncbi:MAG: hypothetical protein K2W96_18070 [Gemmataceae bacterium]|nr:hypothetical protein [Gemmataceae bacterium]
MLTYEGVLRDGRIEWLGAAPAPSSVPLRVRVTVVEDEEATRGERMAAPLARIAARGGIASIPDPIAWQREMREDKPLVGREDD